MARCAGSGARKPAERAIERGRPDRSVLGGVLGPIVTVWLAESFGTAQLLGGGGHRLAAGFTATGPADAVLANLRAALETVAAS